MHAQYTTTLTNLIHDIIIMFILFTDNHTQKHKRNQDCSFERWKRIATTQVDHTTTNCSYCHHLQLDNMQGQTRGDKGARSSCGYQREAVHERPE